MLPLSHQLMVNLKKPQRKRIFHPKKLILKVRHRGKKKPKVMIKINQQKNQEANHKKEEKVNLLFLKH